LGRVSSKVASLKLKKLLMRRALAAIPLLLTLRSEGSSIERLYKKGLLIDEIKDSVKDLKKTFIDKEFEEVQGEADDLSEGWANR